jgi:hypothetical protein
LIASFLNGTGIKPLYILASVIESSNVELNNLTHVYCTVLLEFLYMVIISCWQWTKTNRSMVCRLWVQWDSKAMAWIFPPLPTPASQLPHEKTIKKKHHIYQNLFYLFSYINVLWRYDGMK